MMTTILLAGIFKNLQDVTTSSINQVTEASQKAKEALTLTGGRAVNAITNSKNQVVDTLTQTSQKAKAALSETASQTVDAIATNTEKVKNYGEASLKKASDAGGKASDAFQNPINSWIEAWIHDHPRILWLVSHPLLSLGILFLAILMISGLLKALGGFFEKAWLLILQAPIKLSQVMFGAVYQFIGSLFAKSKEQKILNKSVDLKSLQMQSSDLAKQERLKQISNRLEAINQEQKQLLQEVVELLSLDEVSLNDL